MSQDVSVRGRRSGLRRDTTHHRQRALDAAGPRGHRQGDLVHPERELLDHYERKYLGMDTPGWRHRRPSGRLRRLFRSGLGALARDSYRHHLGVRELHIPPVRTLVSTDDHLHRLAGDPLAVRASAPM